MKLALVHDWLNQIGGAEDVLDVLVRLYPESPLYTSLYAPDIMPAHYRQWDIRPLWLDRLPGIHKHHQPYLPMYPLAWGGLDLSAYDVVLSNKSGFCHGFQHSAQTRCTSVTASRRRATSGKRKATSPVKAWGRSPNSAYAH